MAAAAAPFIPASPLRSSKCLSARAENPPSPRWKSHSPAAVRHQLWPTSIKRMKTRKIAPTRKTAAAANENGKSKSKGTGNAKKPAKTKEQKGEKVMKIEKGEGENETKEKRKECKALGKSWTFLLRLKKLCKNAIAAA